LPPAAVVGVLAPFPPGTLPPLLPPLPPGATVVTKPEVGVGATGATVGLAGCSVQVVHVGATGTGVGSSVHSVQGSVSVMVASVHSVHVVGAGGARVVVTTEVQGPPEQEVMVMVVRTVSVDVPGLWVVVLVQLVVVVTRRVLVVSVVVTGVVDASADEVVEAAVPVVVVVAQNGAHFLSSSCRISSCSCSEQEFIMHFQVRSNIWSSTSFLQ